MELCDGDVWMRHLQIVFFSSPKAVACLLFNCLVYEMLPAVEPACNLVHAGDCIQKVQMNLDFLEMCINQEYYQKAIINLVFHEFQ